MANVQKIIADIYAIQNNDDLNSIVDAIKLKRQQLTKQATRSFVVGDIASFTSNRTGHSMSGKVKKVARKYITVDCGVDGQWRVPGNMLTKLGIGA